MTSPNQILADRCQAHPLLLRCGRLLWCWTRLRDADAWFVDDPGGGALARVGVVAGLDDRRVGTRRPPPHCNAAGKWLPTARQRKSERHRSRRRCRCSYAVTYGPRRELG